MREGLYRYDAVGHLQKSKHDSQAPIGEHITLGPLGTALLPSELPRVLLVDELDKSSYDLPNDLLHVFEEGGFVIDELLGIEGDAARAWPYDRQPDEDPLPLPRGEVRVHHHPVVVVTSNQEREFPPAFLRRCVQLPLAIPKVDEMREVLRSWFPDNDGTDLAELLEVAEGQNVDVVLQALFLARQPHGADMEQVVQALSRPEDPS